MLGRELRDGPWTALRRRLADDGGYDGSDAVTHELGRADAEPDTAGDTDTEGGPDPDGEPDAEGDPDAEPDTEGEPDAEGEPHTHSAVDPDADGDADAGHPVKR